MSAMEGQIILDDRGDPRPVASALCAWCSSQATKRLEVQKAQWTKDHHGTRVMKKRPIVVPVCRLHYDRFRES